MAIEGTDLADLKYAKMLLEEPGIAARVMNLLGMPLEQGFKFLPKTWHGHVQTISEKALEQALHLAVRTLGRRPAQSSADRFHKIAAAASGGVGGMFGLGALGFELSVSTTLMLRSIADIARSEGEDLTDIGARLACLEVFALGGAGTGDDSAEAGYYAVRAALSKAVSDAARFIAKQGTARQGAPVLVRLISQIASRFGVVVTEKAAASAVPIVGAAGGSIINTVFMDHFQDMARGHFIMRRLERAHGKALVRETYERV